MRVWVCGRIEPRDAEQASGEARADVGWQFQGVFDSEAAALAACRDPYYFIGPATLNEALPHELMPEWPGAKWPKWGATE